jgi:hypothetical protein
VTSQRVWASDLKLFNASLEIDFQGSRVTFDGAWFGKLDLLQG